MGVLKDADNLLIGNGDLFLAVDVASLPSKAAYKAARAAGTLPVLAGNLGAIKNTATWNVTREITTFETGLPLEAADQTVTKEGVGFKCSAAELNLSDIQKLIGGGTLTTQTVGATQITDEPVTLTGTGHQSTLHSPILLTTSSPTPATANPRVTTATGPATPGSYKYTTSATGTGTSTALSGNVTASGGETVTIAGTAAATQVYTLVFGGIYTVSYTAQGGDTNTVIATNLAAAVNGTAGTGRVTNPDIKASFSASSSGAVVTLTAIAFVRNIDFIIDLVNSTITRMDTGAMVSAAASLIDYQYLEASSDTLTIGGESNVTTFALRFFHPYKDNRVMMITIFKTNPTGSLAIGFEEAAYSTPEIEFRGIADFSKAAGSHLCEVVLER